jgi:hypothetical protein
MKRNPFAGVSMLCLGALGCRPVLAIGWGEFLILTVVIALLIGPPIYKFLRDVEKSRRQKDE